MTLAITTKASLSTAPGAKAAIAEPAAPPAMAGTAPARTTPHTTAARAPRATGCPDCAKDLVEKRHDERPAANPEEAGEDPRDQAAGNDQCREQRDFANRHTEHQQIPRLRPRSRAQLARPSCAK